MKQVILVLLLSGGSLFSMATLNGPTEATSLEVAWQKTLRDPRCRHERIALARVIWQQKNCLALWQEMAVFYGGVAELVKAYREDSGGENMLNCALMRGEYGVAKWLSQYVYAKL